MKIAVIASNNKYLDVKENLKRYEKIIAEVAEQ